MWESRTPPDLFVKGLVSIETSPFFFVISTPIDLFGTLEEEAHGCDGTVSYTHLRAHETVLDIVCRLLLEKKTHNKQKKNSKQ